jgi:hypothetical protein
MINHRNIGMSDDEIDFVSEHGIDVEKTLKLNKCIRTKNEWNGAEEISIACIHGPVPKILWWYCNPSNCKKDIVAKRKVRYL